MSLPRFHRSPLVLLVALASCRGGGAPLTDEVRASIDSEVRQTVAALLDAMNAHDAEAVLSHYEQSEALTYVGVSDVRVTFDSFARAVAPWYERHPDVTFEAEVVSVRALAPDAAVAVVRGSSTDVSSLAWTQVFVRDDAGRWLIVHEHEAWPGAPEGRRPHPM